MLKTIIDWTAAANETASNRVRRACSAVHKARGRNKNLPGILLTALFASASNIGFAADSYLTAKADPERWLALLPATSQARLDRAIKTSGMSVAVKYTAAEHIVNNFSAYCEWPHELRQKGVYYLKLGILEEAQKGNDLQKGNRDAWAETIFSVDDWIEAERKKPGFCESPAVKEAKRQVTEHLSKVVDAAKVADGYRKADIARTDGDVGRIKSKLLQKLDADLDRIGVAVRCLRSSANITVGRKCLQTDVVTDQTANYIANYFLAQVVATTSIGFARKWDGHWSCGKSSCSFGGDVAADLASGSALMKDAFAGAGLKKSDLNLDQFVQQMKVDPAGAWFSSKMLQALGVSPQGKPQGSSVDKSLGNPGSAIFTPTFSATQVWKHVAEEAADLLERQRTEPMKARNCIAAAQSLDDMVEKCAGVKDILSD